MVQPLQRQTAILEFFIPGKNFSKMKKKLREFVASRPTSNKKKGLKEVPKTEIKG